MAISSVGSTITGAGATLISGVIKSISFGGTSTSAIDVTGITSAFKTYAMGMVEGGTVTVSCFAEAGASRPDLPLAGNTDPAQFVIELGSNTTVGANVYTFLAYLQSASFSAGIDEAVTVDYTLRITGAVTYTVRVA